MLNEKDIKKKMKPTPTITKVDWRPAGKMKFKATIAKDNKLEFELEYDNDTVDLSTDTTPWRPTHG